ncbi:MAG: hypothetical protein WKF71_05200 [Pyrinomonadaceae bacterium]
MADVNRVANKYLTPDKMAIVIVGDRKSNRTGTYKNLGYPIALSRHGRQSDSIISSENLEIAKGKVDKPCLFYVNF